MLVKITERNHQSWHSRKIPVAQLIRLMEVEEELAKDGYVIHDDTRPNVIWVEVKTDRELTFLTLKYSDLNVICMCRD